MRMYGYSERGIMNSLLYDILIAQSPDNLMCDLLELATFPCTKERPPSGKVTVLIEQSLSQFGDADAIIMISSDSNKCTVFIEAKIKTFNSKTWKLESQFKSFNDGLKSKVESSNIFTQLYHKQRFFEELKKTNGFQSLQNGIKFPKWSTRQRRKIGKNAIVHRAVHLIEEHKTTAFYLALVPETERNNLSAFFTDQLCKSNISDVSHYGHISWSEIEAFCSQHKLQHTLDVFGFNEGQIF